MEKNIKIEGLHCANCAAKMEKNIQKIKGVQEANLAFMTQKLHIVYDESREAEILAEVEQACKKVEGACQLKF